MPRARPPAQNQPARPDPGRCDAQTTSFDPSVVLSRRGRVAVVGDPRPRSWSRRPSSSSAAIRSRSGSSPSTPRYRTSTLRLMDISPFSRRCRVSREAPTRTAMSTLVIRRRIRARRNRSPRSLARCCARGKTGRLTLPMSDTVDRYCVSVKHIGRRWATLLCADTRCRRIVWTAQPTAGSGESHMHQPRADPLARSSARDRPRHSPGS